MNAFTYPALVRLINSERPDVIHLHNRQDKVDQLVARLDYRPRVVVHYHRHFKQPTIPISADVLLYPSGATRRYMEQKGAVPSIGAVLHNPLTADLLDQMQKPPQEQSTLRPLRLLFGGGANPVKGGKELLEAFLRWERTDVSLQMVGNGAEIWAECSDKRINAQGGLDSPAFMQLMRESDVIVMPSHTEAFGLLAQESMCLRKLLVTTRVDGLAELVPEDAAVIVEPGNVDSLLAGLEAAYHLYMDQARHSQVTDRAYLFVKVFEPKKIVGQLEKCIYEGGAY